MYTKREKYMKKRQMKIKLPISKIRLLRMMQMNLSSDAMYLFGYKQSVKQIANIHLTLSQIRSSLGHISD